MACCGLPILIPFQHRNRFEVLCPKKNEGRSALINTKTACIEKESDGVERYNQRRNDVRHYRLSFNSRMILRSRHAGRVKNDVYLL